MIEFQYGKRTNGADNRAMKLECVATARAEGERPVRLRPGRRRSV